MKKKFDYRHIICIVITIGICGLGYLFRASFIRLYESFIDIGLSIAYYFCELFNIKHNLVLHINDFSANIPAIELHFSFGNFKEDSSTFFHALFDGSNFLDYLGSLKSLSKTLSYILTTCMPIFILTVILCEKCRKIVNNDYASETKALARAKAFGEKVYLPTKRWLISFFDFCLSKRYIRIWCILLFFIFNLATVVVEFFAWYFYFVTSFSFSSMPIQMVKLVFDLAPTVRFIPLPIWLIVGYLIFDVCRKNIGYSILEHNELKNRGFINERPIIAFVCGTMGSGKTTKIVDMALSQEAMFRDQALDILLEIDFKYPNFPFISYERFLRACMDKRLIFNLASTAQFINAFFDCFKKVYPLDKAYLRSFRRYYKKRLNVDVIPDGNLFGYDFAKYNINFYDGLVINSLFDDLVDYAKAYLVYVVKSSYLIGNLSVRVDDQYLDENNLPIWTNDFFRSRPDLPSRFAHIIDFDALRLGKRMIQDNAKANYFEFGVVLITEIGKERLNALELKEVKKLCDDCNQKNDKFNDFLKMIRHSAMIANRCFVKILTDEQRPDSWGADARDLCEIVTIVNNGEPKMAMPFFGFAKALYDVWQDSFTKYYVDFRYRRGDYSLPLHIRKSLFAKFWTYYHRRLNTFEYYKCAVDIEDGARNQEAKSNYYYISKKKIYSRRFRSDCFADYFAVKSISSQTSLDDVGTFNDVLSTFDEMALMNSYFYATLNDIIGNLKTCDAQKV